MVTVYLQEAANMADRTVALIVVIYLLFSAVNICIKIPLSPLVAIAISTAAALMAFCLTNVERWIKRINVRFNRSVNSYNDSSCVAKVEESSPTSSNEGPLLSSGVRSIEDGQELFIRSSSADMSTRRSIVGSDNLNVSTHGLPIFSTDETKYVSIYSDCSRSGKYGKASEELSVFGRIVERLAFYNYLDLEVQKHCRFKSVRLLYGFNFWFKHMWIKPLLHNAIYVVSGIIITIAWCIVWEWAACYMSREEGKYNLLEWSVELVPEVYWLLEGAFQLVFCMNYLVQLYESDFCYKYIFSLHGFIDLTMTPALTQTMIYVSLLFKFYNVQYGSISNFGLLFFGPLRFLKLTQAEELLNKSFDNLSDVHMIIIGIATAAFSLLFSFSGMMYLLEAPRAEGGFFTPFDFIYFGVATMGTVGYGDFVPRTFLGRSMSILLICTCISLGAVRFKRLKEAITLSDVDMGMRLDVSGYRYVLFWGPMSPYQLLTFCRSIVNSFDGILDTIVVATPLPLETYRVVYRTVKRNTRLNLCIVGGSEEICAPSSVYKLIGLSMLTVVVNDMETDTHDEHIIDDRLAILRSVACLNITKRLGVPIDIQMHGLEYAPFFNSSKLSRICFIRELKYQLIARSVTCRGFFYLVLTLFHTPTNLRRTRAYVEDLYNLFASSNVNMVEDSQAGLTSSLRDVTEQLFEIATGMQFQVYKLEFPRCFYGMTFVEICHYLYKAKNMFLLGLVSNNSCILNPVFETIGVEGEGDVYYGLVLAKSLMDVHHVSLLQNPNLEPFKYEFDGYKTDVSLEVSNCIPENHGETNEENKHPSVTPLNGIYKVDGYEDAMSLFSRPQLQLILVCGWVVDMHRFLTSLLVDNNTNVICLAPLDLVEGIGSLPLSSFRHAVVYMDGSAMDINTLVTAGVLQATCIVVLNSEQSALASNKRHLSKDSQVLFVRHLVKHIDVTHSRQSRPVHIIMDIQHSSCLEYLDPSLVSSMDASCKRHAMNRLWQNFGEFMTSYEMASGTIFVQDMLYGLLAHSYVPSSNSVGYDTIQKLLDNGSTIRNRISLERIPAKFNHETFKSLFIHHISVEHKICIGILRTYQDPLNSEFKQLILVAPQPSFNLHPDDEVYVVEPNVVSK